LSLPTRVLLDPIFNTDRFVIPDDFNGLSDEIKEDQRYLLEVIMKEKEKGEKIGLEEGEKIGLEEGKMIGFEKGERKVYLSTILIVLKSGEDLKNWKFLTKYFSKNEIEIIKDFEENPYDIKTFAEKIKVKEEDILDICKSIAIELEKEEIKIKIILFFYIVLFIYLFIYLLLLLLLL